MFRECRLFPLKNWKTVDLHETLAGIVPNTSPAYVERVIFDIFFFLVSGTRPPGTTKKELKCRPSRNTSRHCPNASPAYLESIIWPRVTQRSVSKISTFVFFETFFDVLFFVGSWTSPAKAKMMQKSLKKESEGML